MLIRNRMARFRFTSIKWLLSYLAVALVVTGCAGYTYGKARGIAVDNIERYTLEMLLNARDQVEVRLEAAVQNLTRLASHHQTSMALNAGDPVENSRMYELSTYVALIRSMNHPMDIFEDVLVYSDLNGYIFSGNNAVNIRDYYRTTYLDESGEGFDLWFEERMQGEAAGRLYPAETVRINGMQTRVVPYVRTLPLGSVSRYQGAICAMIRYDDLFSGFVDSGQFGYCYIRDGQGSLLAGTREEAGLAREILLPQGSTTGCFTQEVAGRSMIVVYAKSEASELEFVAVTPYSAAMSQVSQLRGLFYLSLSACLAVCLLIAALFIRHNVPPIAALCQLLTEHLEEGQRPGSGADFVQQSVRQLLRENLQMRDSLQQQLGQMQASYLSRLLTGSIPVGGETSAVIRQAGLLPGRRYTVVLIQIAGCNSEISDQTAEELGLYKMGIRRLLEPLEEWVAAVDTGVDRLALVFSFDAEEPDKCRRYAQQVIRDIRDFLAGYPLAFTAAGGGLYKAPADLYHACWEAEQVLKKNIPDPVRLILWHEDGQAWNHIFYYPVEVEQRLLTFVRSGDEASMEGLLDTVFATNYEKIGVSGAMECTLFDELHATLLKAADDLASSGKEDRGRGLMETAAFPEGTLTREQYCAALRESFRLLCREVQERRAHRSSALRREVAAFVDNHYRDPALSLSLVADRFSLSDSYLSTFFKEQTGENFLSYVERLRLETACRMLQEKGRTVEEIAGAVGYTSAHSFRRAFKRRYGVSPGGYGEAEMV